MATRGSGGDLVSGRGRDVDRSSPGGVLQHDGRGHVVLRHTGRLHDLGQVLTTATQVVVLATAAYAVLPTIAFSLYLYSAELYPTRLRAIGTGFGSAWLRAGSSIGPVLVGFVVSDLGIHYVFAVFAAVALIGGLVTMAFAVETKGPVLEELSP